jgi:hypothetical protein
MADLSAPHAWKNPGSLINNDLVQFAQAMTNQHTHRATTEQWAKCEQDARLWSGAFNCILELRARIEALEAAQLEQSDVSRLDMAVKTTPLPPHINQFTSPATTELRAASAEAQVKTTHGSEAAGAAINDTGEPSIGDAYGGGYFAGYISHTADGVATHRLIVAPAATRGLVERVQNVICGIDPPSDWESEARAAIRAVADWLDVRGNCGSAAELRQEANHG